MPDLEEKFNNLKNEIDALQIAFTSQNSPWYKNVPVWVSILALLFSFGTTYASLKRSEDQNIQSMKSELRGMLQRLATLPTAQFELSKKYECDKNAIGFLGSQINQESTLLAKQSASLAKKIPENIITSTEYYSIAVALQNSYQLDDAVYYYKLAVKSSESVNDEVAARRGIANLKLLSGQPELGRVKFQETLNVFSNYPDHNDYTIKSTHIWTYLGWANAEAAVGRLDFANNKIDEAKKIVATLLPSPGRALLEGQIVQTKAQLNEPNLSKHLEAKCQAFDTLGNQKN